MRDPCCRRTPHSSTATWGVAAGAPGRSPPFAACRCVTSSSALSRSSSADELRVRVRQCLRRHTGEPMWTYHCGRGWRRGRPRDRRSSFGLSGSRALGPQMQVVRTRDHTPATGRSPPPCPKKSARGMRPRAQALLCLARPRAGVLFAMLRDRTSYAPQPAAAARSSDSRTGTSSLMTAAAPSDHLDQRHRAPARRSGAPVGGYRHRRRPHPSQSAAPQRVRPLGRAGSLTDVSSRPEQLAALGTAERQTAPSFRRPGGLLMGRWRETVPRPSRSQRPTVCGIVCVHRVLKDTLQNHGKEHAHRVRRLRPDDG